MEPCSRRLVCTALFLTGIFRFSGGLDSYHVYKEDWREKECGRVLSRVQHEPVKAPVPPSLTGEWSSYRCEIRSGPEYILRKYKFDKTTFEVHQYFYFDPDCSQPKYAIVARGSYKLLRESWLIPGGTEAVYHVIKAHVIPYTPEVAAMFEETLHFECPELGKMQLRPFTKQLFMSIPPETKDDEYDDNARVVADIDCSRVLNFSLVELQLMRVEIRSHYKHHHFQYRTNQQSLKLKEENIKITKELLLGNMHTSRQQRHRHRPSSYQTALRHIQTQGCGVCAKVANSNNYYPPELRKHFGTIMSLQGEWVSTRCESRQHGMFLTRWLSFLPDGRSWQGRYAYYHDPLCTKPSFILHAKGSYAGGVKSWLIPNAKDYSFKVTRLKITPKDYQVTEHLNYYDGAECGAAKSWETDVEQDVTFTNGCVTLGIRLPNIEQEIMKMEVVHRKLHLYVGRRLTGEPTNRFKDKRPTSFQEPLIKCNKFNMDMHVNSIYEGQALPLMAADAPSSSTVVLHASMYLSVVFSFISALFKIR